jgi:2-keto-3-deoxy-L-rhamnonate aldolase RhmA
MTTVRENRLRAAITAGRIAQGIMLEAPAPWIVEFLGHRGGLDFALLDGEHGPVDARDIDEFCRACDLVGLTPLARVPDSSKASIGRYLDRGIRGIIVPHVKTAAEARAIVAHTRYAPEGERSYGAGRTDLLGAGIADLPAHCRAWNATVTIGAMLEDRAALENLDAILAVPGIDYFLFGPNDFAQALGHPGDPDHPEVKRAMAQTADRIRSAGGRMREDVLRACFVRDLLQDGMGRWLDHN